MLLLVWEYLLNGNNGIQLSYLLLGTGEKIEAFHNATFLQQKKKKAFMEINHLGLL